MKQFFFILVLVVITLIGLQVNSMINMYFWVSDSTKVSPVATRESAVKSNFQAAKFSEPAERTARNNDSQADYSYNKEFPPPQTAERFSGNRAPAVTTREDLFQDDEYENRDERLTPAEIIREFNAAVVSSASLPETDEDDDGRITPVSSPEDR